METLKSKIFHFATQTLGFDDCRFTTPELSDALVIYKEWLDHGYHGEMDYLKKHFKFKENPELLLGGVKSAIVLIKNYRNTLEPKINTRTKLARYAVGKDYHFVIGEKLKELENFIKNQNADIKCYAGVDSRPIAERSLALKAGIGFLGKNSMVIRPGLGSYFFIGVVLTTHTFEPDDVLKWDCGSCRLCIDACPTQAINNDSTLNAVKCISYQTIERKDPLSADEIKQAKGWLFGCDICQEVCPYNTTAPLTNWKEFLPESGIGFDFFEKRKLEIIPKDSAVYRSRARIIQNHKLANELI
ncbi:MAG: tRNA epoxyqueuosine(34) reductase QueG [Candidatus Omnitrophota bacterium]